MKKISTFLAVGLLIVLLPGCKKLCDFIEQHPDADLKDCPITQIISTPCCDESDTLDFTYNAWGDPVSVLRRPLVKTGHPNYFFKYDSWHRLTDIIAAYANGTAEQWHKYFYASAYSTRIVRDSTYTFPTITTGFPESALFTSLTYYDYDAQGRIIRDSTLSSAFPTIVNHYSYDGAGNRVGRSYDTKLNVHRTNKIWMFYDRDYSINNPFIADTYNSKSLPTSINTPSDASGGYLDFLNESTTVAKISYACK
jgi:hypothetical protein